MANHTPGDWKKVAFYIIADYRKGGANRHIATLELGQKPGMPEIEGETLPLDEIEENGYLIAAAPDMYDAIRNALSDPRRDPETGLYCLNEAEVDRLRLAGLKARGVEA